MKKRTKIKTSKSSKSSAKSSRTAKDELPELVAVMMKIAERLDALEKKTDTVLSQTSALLSQPRAVPQNSQRPDSSHITPSPQPGTFGSQPSHGQGGRVLHKAVCADCHQDCEVPFKPSGDRPIYCKECFAKRKAARSSKGNDDRNRNTEQSRLVKVIPNGMGKVTISDISNRTHPQSLHRNFSGSRKANAVSSARHNSSERRNPKHPSRPRR